MESHITHLPPEVFSILTSFLPYEDLETFWRTNSRKIIAILGQSRGVRKIIYHCKSKNAKWPRLQEKISTLAAFTIISVLPSVDVKSDIAGPQYNQLLALPSSLVSISFTFPRAESCWIVGMNGDKQVPFIDTTKEQMITTAKYLSIANLLPQLQSLELVGHEAISDEWVETLPPTLTLLNLRNNNNLTDDCIPKLPRHLETLILNNNKKLTGSGLQNLPLQTLWLHGSNIADSAFFSHLPASLTELNIPSNRSLRNEHMTKIPIGLQKLNLHLNTTITGSAFSFFPTSLQALNICTQVSDSDIARLPANMTNLILNNCSDLTNEAIGMLPRSLTSFSSWKTTNITDEAISLLPRAIRYLYLDAPLLTDECAKMLPSDLIELRLQSAPFTNAFFSFFKENPSKRLVRLETSGAQDVGDEAIANLPRTLLFLHLPLATGVTPAAIPDLPPNLRTFILWSSSGFLNFDNKLFPPSLRCFYASDHTMLPDIF
jgi:hypothetical protein